MVALLVGSQLGIQRKLGLSLLGTVDETVLGHRKSPSGKPKKTIRKPVPEKRGLFLNSLGGEQMCNN